MKINAFFNFLELEARFNIEKTKVIDIVIKSIAIERDTRGDTVESLLLLQPFLSLHLQHQ